MTLFKALVVLGTLTLAGCSAHNDQRSCTHDCNISGGYGGYGGYGVPYAAPIVGLSYYGSSYYGPRFRRGWRRRSPVVIYHW